MAAAAAAKQNLELSIENIRCTSNSMSASYTNNELHTPVCSQDSGSIASNTRRYRKPLRKLNNVQNKTVSKLKTPSPTCAKP